MQRGALVFVVAALGLAAGFGLAKLGGGDPPATPPVAAAPSPDGEADALRARLRASEDEREALEAEVALLREALAIAGASAPEAPAPRAEAVADAAPPKSPPEGSDTPWFDAEGLASQGVGEAEIEALRARFEQYQMDELYLRDEAVRDGWYRSDRYRKSLRRLRNETRVELGDEDYDLLLFATGRNSQRSKAA